VSISRCYYQKLCTAVQDYAFFEIVKSINEGLREEIYWDFHDNSRSIRNIKNNIRSAAWDYIYGRESVSRLFSISKIMTFGEVYAAAKNWQVSEGLHNLNGLRDKDDLILGEAEATANANHG